MSEVVIREVLWTNLARRSFHNIIEYLRQEWSEREVENFLNRTDEMLIAIKKYPEM